MYFNIFKYNAMIIDVHLRIFLSEEIREAD